jgi:predicted glycogen debranching enzyme
LWLIVFLLIVLTLQKAKGSEILSISTRDKSVDELLTKEWLLTNESGGYASSTIIGCNTRGYHGLLIGSLNPPANRIMALANCLEMVICGKNIFNLSTFEFSAGSPSDSDKFVPAGFSYITQFSQDAGVHFHYELTTQAQTNGDTYTAVPHAYLQRKTWQNSGLMSRKAASLRKRVSTVKLTKSVYLTRKDNTVALVYRFTNIEEPVEFILRPFVGMRDFHTLQKSYAPLSSSWLDDFLLIRSAYGELGNYELFLSSPSMNPLRNYKTRNNMIQREKISNGVKFEKDEQWWFNFVYRNDRERGQNFTEDLWTPGFFKCHIESPIEVVFWTTLALPSANHKLEQLNSGGIQTVIEDLCRHQRAVIRAAKATERKLIVLCLAADQFIAKRNTDQSHSPSRLASEDAGSGRTTILAGYPWFADWGRDAFISLPGLLLCTGRFDEAKSVLTTFAQAADEGMIPNRFDDHSSTAYFNSVDASLWFINAAFQYLSITGDSKTFTQELLPVIRWIIDSYQKGTRFGIHADVDGLITAGDSDTQLTWMDAKYDGIAITARCGKAVEVNALWYNALCFLSRFYTERNSENAEHYQAMAHIVGTSFLTVFWNEAVGYANDHILPNGSADASLRPNQIFAVSLPFSPPLSNQQQKSIIDCIQKELLTAYGLRTLNTQHNTYRGIYTGPQQQRDEAYHQGTVWPYLLGPFVEAYLKVNGFSRKSKRKAAEIIAPLMQHLTQDGCLGQICEIFDGDVPHKPKGCFAQAWSVAELLRAYQLVNS